MKYYKRFDITEEVRERIAYLKRKKQELVSIYNKMPEGNLQVAPGSSTNSFRYYLRKTTAGKCGEYLDKSKKRDKEIYARKKYIKELLKNIDVELNKLEKIINLQLSDSIINTYESLNPGIKRLIDPINIDDDSYVSLWRETPYIGLGFDENDTSAHYSNRNERMRSKSEVLIANALILRGIPYKYECPVERKNGELLYPDFTILDVKNRREIYWEHLGKLGDSSYVMKSIWKLEEYRKVDIHLGMNLLLTCESNMGALRTDEINKTIDSICG